MSLKTSFLEPSTAKKCPQQCIQTFSLAKQAVPALVPALGPLVGPGPGWGPIRALPIWFNLPVGPIHQHLLHVIVCRSS